MRQPILFRHILPKIIPTLLIFMLLETIVTPPYLIGEPLSTPQVQQEVGACDDLLYLMRQQITPDELLVGGGLLGSGVAEIGQVGGKDGGDIWALSLNLLEGEDQTPITIAFRDVNVDAPLEFAVFWGMEPISDTAGMVGFQPLTENTFQFEGTRNGYYSIVVRLQHISQIATLDDGSYEIEVVFRPGVTVSTSIQDGERSVLLDDMVEFDEGRLALTFPFRNGESPTAYAHAGSISAIGTLGGNAAQTWFVNPARRDNLESPGTFEANYAYSTAVAIWGQRISYLAGDFSVTSTRHVDDSDQRRVFYVENFGYQKDLRSVINLDRFVDDNTDSNGTLIRLNWESISGFWMLKGCVGFRTADGREFMAVLDADSPEPRSAVFGQFAEDVCTPVSENGEMVDRFRISVRSNLGNSDSGESETANHQLCLSWIGVTQHDDSNVPEIVLDDGVFAIQLVGKRLLRLEATDIRLERADENGVDDANQLLNVEILDKAINLTTDWYRLVQFDYLDGNPIFTFLDDVVRTSTTRDGSNLERVEALDESIRLIYRDEGDSEGIKDRLILPAEDGYAEILTPTERPALHSAVSAESPLFTPRGLNNVGHECYPINTMQLEANCPPNGDINPANGNLWYSVVDHQAYGYQFDLILSRSYNSTQFNANGSFGYGWHTPFQLDYGIDYDATLNARPISASDAFEHPLRLNLTWSPYGIVRFTTESGSQHLFVTDAPIEVGDYFDGGTLTSISMPNWSLSRENAHSQWKLTQADGLTYQFDRAGRLIEYGYPADQYPNYDRMVRINRLSEDTFGHWSVDPSQRQTDIVVVTDAEEMRRLELYFDLNSHHITRSILRDMTTVARSDLDADLLEQVGESSSEIETHCEADENCFEIRYGYEDDFLRTVVYPDGLQATYSYDEQGRLIGHDDPRAPISSSMDYQYFEDSGRIETASINVEGEHITWRTRTVENENDIESAAQQYYVAVSNGGNSGEAFGRLTSTLPLFEPQRLQPILENYARLPNGVDLIIGELWAFYGERVVSVLDEHQVQSTLAADGMRYTFSIGNETPWDASESYALRSIDYANGYRIRHEWENGLIVSEQVDQNGDDFRSDVIYSYHPETAIIREISDATYPLFRTTAIDSSALLPTWVFLPKTIQWENRRPQQYEYTAEGWLATYQDENGGEYSYVWDSTHQWLHSVRRENDGLTTRYENYNVVGQVGNITTEASGNDSGDITKYEWDGLGRLVGVDSSTLGRYQIEYIQLHCASIEGNCSVMRVIDPLGALSIYHFDGKGRLIESILYNGNETDDILRHTAYEYQNYLGWISAEIGYLYGDDGTREALITRYEYEHVFDDDMVGISVIRIDAYGRRQESVYDVIGRVRETIDEFGHVTRYHYDYYGTQHPLGYYRQGLKITQQDFYPNSVVETDYFFNRRWQLNYIERDGLAWVFQPNGNSTQLERLLVKPSESPESIAVGNWEYDESGQISNLEIAQQPFIDLFGNENEFNAPALDRDYDFLGRPTQIRDGEGMIRQYGYCPLSNGKTQVVQSPPLVNPTPDFGCDSSDVEVVMQYDSQQRIRFVQDELGAREFVYTFHPDLHEWQVVMTTAQDDEHFIWKYRYNAAGDLVQWIDDGGIIRNYEYDSLGRLKRVVVDEESLILLAVDEYYERLEIATNSGERDLAYQELRLAIGFMDREGLQNIFEDYTFDAVEALLITLHDTKQNQPVGIDFNHLIRVIEGSYSGSIDIADLELLIMVLAEKVNPEASFRFVYNAADFVTQEVDDLGRGFAYTYNSFGQMTAKRNLKTGDTTTYVYTSTGLLRSVISPLGNNTTYLYDDESQFDPTRLTQVIDAAGGQHRYTWDDVDGTLTYTNPLGNQTVYHYDSFGMLWQITDSLGGQYEARYNHIGELTAWLRTDEEGETLQQSFNLAYSPENGQLNINESETENWGWQFEQLPSGVIGRVTSPTGQITVEYDGLGRIDTLVAGDYGWAFEQTQGLPQLRSTVRQNNVEGHPTLFSFDALNRVIDGDPIGYRYAYPQSAEDEYTGIVNLRIQHSGETYVYTFSPGNTSAFQSRGQEVVLRTNGQNIHYLYDTEGLLSQITTETCGTNISESLAAFDLQSDIFRESPNACLNNDEGEIVSSTVQIRYDEQGRLVSVADSEQNLEAFVYNDAGNLITYRNQIGQSFSYEYDALNRLTSLTSPGGIVLLLKYNGLDRVVGLCQTRLEPNNTTDYEQCVANGGLIEQYEYDNLSRLTLQRFPNIDGEDGFSEIETHYSENSVIWGDSPDNQVELIINNPLSLLDMVVLSSGSTYEMMYDPTGQVAAVSDEGGLEFDVNDEGHVEAVSVNDSIQMNYEYDAEGQHGFAISDESGTVIGFVLNVQGRLIGINYNTEPLIEFIYDTNAGEMLLTTAWVEDGSTTMREIDEQAANPSLVSHNFEGRLTLIPLTNPLGQIQRQQTQGTQSFFDHANGYSIVTSYDAGGRPLVMRIADADPDNVTLLYTLAFTYDEYGRRQQETRQYNDPDATQIDIQYRYAYEDGVEFPNRNQLIEREVVVSSENGQQQHLYEYGYDERGNLSSVRIPEQEEACLIYEFDSANRLARVNIPSLNEAHNYQYDIYNRLVGIDEWMFVYHGATTIPFLATNGDERIYYVQTGDGVSLFQADEDGIYPLLHDGASGIFGDGTASEAPLWLFDPIGRLISLSDPISDHVDSGCAFLLQETYSARLAAPQHVFENMAWDQETNLYFSEGRAYSPEIGQFLQRDPLGADAFGNVYQYPSRQLQPPILQSRSAYQEGLVFYSDAMEIIRNTTALTAETIQQEYYPKSPVQNAYILLTTIQQQSETFVGNIKTFSYLPMWISENYNLPIGSIDPIGGGLSWATQKAPGQSHNGPDHVVVNRDVMPNLWLDDSMASTASQLESFYGNILPELHTFTLYEAPQYQSTRGNLVSQVIRPNLWDSTPNAIFERLPHPLFMPEQGISSMQIAQMLENLPNITGEQFISNILTFALPQHPELPPLTIDALRQRQFGEDIFGVEADLELRFPSPLAPSVQLPYLGIQLPNE